VFAECLAGGLACGDQHLRTENGSALEALRCDALYKYTCTSLTLHYKEISLTFCVTVYMCECVWCAAVLTSYIVLCPVSKFLWAEHALARHCQIVRGPTPGRHQSTPVHQYTDTQTLSFELANQNILLYECYFISSIDEQKKTNFATTDVV